MTTPKLIAPSEGETVHYGRPMKGSGDPVSDAMRTENRALAKRIETLRLLVEEMAFERPFAGDDHSRAFWEGWIIRAKQALGEKV